MKTIDLGNYRAKGGRIISGREKGELLRKEVDLDSSDITDEKVQVIVPDDLLIITSSFFLGLFGKSVQKLKRSKFEENYQFSSPDRILGNIEEAKTRALLESNVLAQC